MVPVLRYSARNSGGQQAVDEGGLAQVLLAAKQEAEVVYDVVPRGGGHHTYEEVGEPFLPEVGVGGAYAAGEARQVVDAVPGGQLLHVQADGVVGLAEVGVDEVAYILDVARVAGFVQFHPDGVLHLVVQLAEGAGATGTALHAVLHQVVAGVVVASDVLLDVQEIPLGGGQLAGVELLGVAVGAHDCRVQFFGGQVGEVGANEELRFVHRNAVAVVGACQLVQVVVAVPLAVRLLVVVPVEQGGKQGAAFAGGVADMVRRPAGGVPDGFLHGAFLPSRRPLGLLPEGKGRIDDEHLRVGVEVDFVIVGQVAEARHVLAGFVEAGVAELLVEGGYLVVGMGMIVPHLVGRLGQAAVGKAGAHGDFAAAAARAAEADVGVRTAFYCVADALQLFFRLLVKVQGDFSDVLHQLVVSPPAGEAG